MGRTRSVGDQWFAALLGFLLLALSTGGLIHAVRASVAAHGYKAAKYAAVRPAPEAIMAGCRAAYEWYPWNYYFSIEAAELAYRQSESASTNAAAWLQQSQWWCERGLVQNPYKSQLRRLKTRFLWTDAPAQAIAYWAAYTDWHYWEPYNHAVLSELYAEAGDFDRADRELALIKTFPDYADAAAGVERERRTWNAMLRGDLDGFGR